MNGKRLLIGLAIVLLMGGAVYAALHYRNSTLNAQDSDFSVKDTARIHYITLTGKTGYVLKLERKSNGWRVNNMFTAAHYMISQLLGTLYNISVKYPVVAPAYQHTLADMAGTAIEVDIRDADKKTMKRLYIGGPDLSSTGTFTKLADHDEIFATCIPGFDGYLTTRFSPIEADWRDRHLFPYNVDQISKLIVAYKSHPDSSYEMDILGPDSFKVFDYTQKQVRVHHQKVIMYLLNLNRLQSEAIINESLAKDTTVRQSPFCNMTIQTRDGGLHSIAFYRKGLTRSSQEQMDPKTGNTLPYDMERALAMTDSDFLLVQYKTINKALRHLQDFKQ